MSLIKHVGTTKKAYIRAEDEQIVSMRNEGTSVKDIAEATGRTAASVQYRISRKLNTVDSFDDIKYKAVPASK